MGKRHLALGVAITLLAVTAAAAWRFGFPRKAGPAASVVRTMHVWDVDAVSFAAPSTTAKEVERIRIGTPLSVKPSGNPGYYEIVSGTKKAGFVATRALRPDVPQAAALAASARDLLAEGAVPGAIEDAERAIALDPKQADALDLLAAIYDVRAQAADARRVRGLRDASGAPKPTPTPDAAPETFPAPAAGQTRWVAATKLLVKADPAIDAKTIAELPINTAVEARETRADWVRISWGPGGARVIDVDLESGKVETIAGTAGEGLEGWARARFLSPSQLTRESLLTQAEVLEQRGHLTEATRRLERAAALAPDVATVERLARVATKAGLFHIAARAGSRFAAAPGATSSAAAAQSARVLDIAIAWGCRGDRTRAIWVEESALGNDLSAWSENACVRGVPDVPCPPCETPDWYIEDEADPKKLAELRAAEAESFRQAGVEHLEKVRRIEARLTALRAAFPDGPFVRIEMPAGQVPAGQSLFVYGRSFSAVGGCESYVEPPGEPELSPAIPGSDAEHRTLWVKADWSSVLYGVVTAADAASTASAFEVKADAYLSSPEQLGPAPNVYGTLGTGGCGCCGC